MEAALAEGATLLHPDLGTNASAHWVFDSGEAGTGGSAKEAIAAAEKDPDAIVVRRRFRQQRLIPAFMEPRSVVVDPSGEQLTMWSATQIPHILKTLAAATTGVPEHKLRVIAPDVGGGFGGKLQVTPEEILVLAASVKLGKPVKWTETRSESLLSAHHGRDQIQDITIAAKRDGTVLALDVDLLADMGAYLRLVTSGIPILGAFMFNSIYKFPAYRFACTNVFTSKTPTDAYRGAGRPEATFAIERIMDELAVELGREPLELREQNWIKHEEFPFTTVCGLEYDSGNYEAATAKAKELFDYDAPAPRAAGAPRVGRPGPARHRHLDVHRDVRAGALAACSGRWRTARAAGRPRRSGCCRSARSRSSPGRPAHGQGHETAWSQIVADQLGVPFEDIEVLHGDTQISPRGMDTYGSRSLAVGGIAVVKAAEKVVAKARTIAAHLLEASEDDLEFSGGRFGVKGTGKGVTIQEVATATWAAHNLPDGVEPSLDSDATYDPDNFSFPHGTHLAAMEVDTETGRVTIRRVRLRRRRRQRAQPADRRGAGARRPRPGHRAGAVRGGQLRRAGHAGQRHVRRLHPALGGGPAQLHHGPHRDPGDGQPAGRQGRRRGGHDRLDAGDRQRRARRGAPPGRDGRRDAVHAAARVAGDPGGAGPCHPGDAGRHPLAGCRPRLDRPEQPAGRRGPVIPAQFDYVRPGTVDEAVAALQEAGEDAKILAGGQSLIPVLRLRLAAPSTLIDLGGIPELRRIRDDGDRIAIGAMAPHHDVMRDDLVKRARRAAGPGHGDGGGQPGPAPRDPRRRARARRPGRRPGRRRPGAGGGVRDRRARAARGRCRRTSSSSTTSPPRSAEDEILTEVRFPKYTGWGSHYEKFNRTAQSWSMVAIAAAVRIEGGTIAEARVGLTNMGATPLRARGVEEALVGQPATAEAVRAAAERVTEGTAAPSDADAAADYREHLARVLTGRAVLAAAG